MTKAKDFLYQIQYHDNTYRMIDVTKSEFKEIGEAIVSGQKAIMLDDMILDLQYVRGIVLVPEPEPEQQPETAEENKLTEWGFVDPDTAAWLKSQGINLSEGGN